MRDVDGETDGGPVLLAETELQQRGHAPRHLQPVHDGPGAGDQLGPGPVGGQAERAGVRDAHGDAVEPHGQLGAQPGGHRTHGSGEALPLMIGLGPGQQQERRSRCVVREVDGQFGRLVLLPVVLVERHRGAAGPVIDQAVRVERHHRLVLQAAKQVRGEQSAGRARVDESVQVVEHDCSIQFRRVGAHLVEIPRISHHDHSLLRRQPFTW